MEDRDRAHKIKNLLTGIRAFADLMKRKTKDETSIEYLGKIEQKVDDIVTIIDSSKES